MITKAQLFDLLSDKHANIWEQNIKCNGQLIYGIKVCEEYPEALYCYDQPAYDRDVFCIFAGALYIMKEDVIDLLRGKAVSIYNKQGIEVLAIYVEE